jgi:hypothetical protein
MTCFVHLGADVAPRAGIWYCSISRGAPETPDGIRNSESRLPATDSLLVSGTSRTLNANTPTAVGRQKAAVLRDDTAAGRLVVDREGARG